MPESIPIWNLIRFTRTDRQNAFRKGEFGTVRLLLGWPPLNDHFIYLVQKNETLLWATEEDIERWDQLSLMDS